MTLGDALREAEALLRSHDVADAPWEAEVLLMHTLGMDRARLYASLDYPMPPDIAARWQELLERRLGREPTAYIVGHQEFYGLDFYVDPRVLIPRPESELLVEQALSFARSLPLRPRPFPLIADVGVGSGALAVALACHLPEALVYATDISRGALEVAAANCLRHGVQGRVRLLHGDLLEPVPELVDMVVANLPYVPDALVPSLAPEIRLHEPVEALMGGVDGLDAIRRLVAQAGPRLRGRAVLFVEFAWDQGREAEALGRALFPEGEIAIVKDYAGHDRVLAIYQRGAVA